MYSQIAGTAIDVLTLHLVNRKCLPTKPIQIFHAKVTHHGNVAFADMLKKKHKHKVSSVFRSLQHSSVHYSPAPLQCGSSNTVWGCGPFKAQNYKKIGRGKQRQAEKRSTELHSKI